MLPGLGATVARLVSVGVVITWAGIALAAIVLFDGLDHSLDVLIGAVLVVSGPTVVLPLLAHIRPSGRVRSLLKWEGVLVDPIGALLGVLVLRGVKSSAHHEAIWVPGELFLSLAIGAVVGAVAAVVLLVLLREVHRNAPRYAVSATLMMVVAAVVAADLLRDDTGLVAATLMGAALGNQRRVDIALTREFQETLVQLLIGVLFILIAALGVALRRARACWDPRCCWCVLIALVIRPLAVAASTIAHQLHLAGARVRRLDGAARDRGRRHRVGVRRCSWRSEPVPGSGHLLPIVFVVSSAPWRCTGSPVPPRRGCWGWWGRAPAGARRRRQRLGAGGGGGAVGRRRRGARVGRPWRRPGRAARGRARCGPRPADGGRGQPRGRAGGGHRCAAAGGQRRRQRAWQRRSFAPSSATATSTAIAPDPEAADLLPPFGEEGSSATAR